MVRDLGHMFFAVPMDDESQPMTAFPWEGRGDQFAGLAQGYLSSPVMAHNTTFQHKTSRPLMKTHTKPSISYRLRASSFMVIPRKNRRGPE